MVSRRPLIGVLVLASTLVATAAGTLQTPEQFLGFKVGADNKLIRWDKIVDYMKLAAANSDRVRFRELGKTSDSAVLLVLEGTVVKGTASGKVNGDGGAGEFKITKKP
jgi:hypothetical protein